MGRPRKLVVALAGLPDTHPGKLLLEMVHLDMRQVAVGHLDTPKADSQEVPWHFGIQSDENIVPEVEHTAAAAAAGAMIVDRTVAVAAAAAVEFHMDSWQELAVHHT
jgi:hypothetical protein